MRCGDIVQRDCGDQCQRGRGRIVGEDADERAGIKVAGRRLPAPALPPAPAGLAVGAQPQSLARSLGGERGDIVVGGPGLGDRADQKSALAAFCDTASR